MAGTRGQGDSFNSDREHGSWVSRKALCPPSALAPAPALLGAPRLPEVSGPRKVTVLEK